MQARRKETEVNKTRHYFDWTNGYYKSRTLSKSFDTLSDAEKFAKGKDVVDIYRSKGKIKVEWIKRAKE